MVQVPTDSVFTGGLDLPQLVSMIVGDFLAILEFVKQSRPADDLGNSVKYVPRLPPWRSSAPADIGVSAYWPLRRRQQGAGVGEWVAEEHVCGRGGRPLHADRRAEGIHMKKRVPNGRGRRPFAGRQRRRPASRNANNPTPYRVYTAISEQGGIRAGEPTAIRRGLQSTLNPHPVLRDGAGSLAGLPDSKPALELLGHSRTARRSP